MLILLKQSNIPKTNHAGFKADGIVELFAQSIIQGKHAGSGIESQTSKERYIQMSGFVPIKDFHI